MGNNYFKVSCFSRKLVDGASQYQISNYTKSFNDRDRDDCKEAYRLAQSKFVASLQETASEDDCHVGFCVHHVPFVDGPWIELPIVGEVREVQ